MDILSLPVVMIEHIISYLSYDEIAKNRLADTGPKSHLMESNNEAKDRVHLLNKIQFTPSLKTTILKLYETGKTNSSKFFSSMVSKAFNEICMRMLNRGFMMIERRHTLALKSVKAQLPRRESERRYHPLSRHCDILTSIETRISMLNMTYSKFIDGGLCCFIPGKVIDEIKRVLSLVETSSSPPRAHEVLQELRDISSMAIEHFDDKVSPAFRKRLQETSAAPRTASPRDPHMVLAPYPMHQEMWNLRRRSVVNARLSLCLSVQYKKFYRRMVHYKRIVAKQHGYIKLLMKKQKQQDAAIADLKKRIEECDIKYNELTHTNQAAGGKAISASAAGEVSSAPQQPLRHFSSQIKLDLSVIPIGTSKRAHSALIPNMKPRKPMIKLPSLSEDDPEPPSKLPRTESNRSSPVPSTSQSSPKLRSQSTLAKIRGITSEIRHLSNLSKRFETKLKRAPGVNAEACVPEKKQKLD